MANSRHTLPRLAHEYFAEVRALLEEDPKPKDLHQARLATKRFRYTLELFRPCYGAGFEARISSLRKIQQLLGDVNDSVASWAFLSKKMEKSAQRTQVGRFLDARARHDAEEFHKEWKKHFDAPGRERWWKDFLAGRTSR